MATYLLCCSPGSIQWEARENLNHDEYVEEENYYNVDSDDSDINAN